MCCYGWNIERKVRLYHHLCCWKRYRYSVGVGGVEVEVEEAVGAFGIGIGPVLCNGLNQLTVLKPQLQKCF